mmetsp:Transcript_28552/g.77268  ORF Transcript_28552/g.77268 Transcript_28552/m.77268 type:complete len:115 (-) Transcript_28552:19-363(-)
MRHPISVNAPHSIDKLMLDMVYYGNSRCVGPILDFRPQTAASVVPSTCWTFATWIFYLILNLVRAVDVFFTAARFPHSVVLDTTHPPKKVMEKKKKKGIKTIINMCKHIVIKLS